MIELPPNERVVVRIGIGCNECSTPIDLKIKRNIIISGSIELKYFATYMSSEQFQILNAQWREIL